MDMREALEKELQRWFETDKGNGHDKSFTQEADAILALFAEERAALMAVAEKNEGYEEAIERDRDAWKDRALEAEAERLVWDEERQTLGEGIDYWRERAEVSEVGLKVNNEMLASECEAEERAEEKLEVVERDRDAWKDRAEQAEALAKYNGATLDASSMQLLAEIQLRTAAEAGWLSQARRDAAEIVRLEASRDALRVALREIADWDHYDGGGDPMGYPHKAGGKEWEKFHPVSISDAALAVKEEPK